MVVSCPRLVFFRCEDTNKIWWKEMSDALEIGVYFVTVTSTPSYDNAFLSAVPAERNGDSDDCGWNLLVAV